MHTNKYIHYNGVTWPVYYISLYQCVWFSKYVDRHSYLLITSAICARCRWLVLREPRYKGDYINTAHAADHASCYEAHYNSNNCTYATSHYSSNITHDTRHTTYNNAYNNTCNNARIDASSTYYSSRNSCNSTNTASNITLGAYNYCHIAYY